MPPLLPNSSKTGMREITEIKKNIVSNTSGLIVDSTTDLDNRTPNTTGNGKGRTTNETQVTNAENASKAIAGKKPK